MRNIKRAVCKIFGHRVNADPTHFWCGRCGLAYEEIYGHAYWDKLQDWLDSDVDKEDLTVEDIAQVEMWQEAMRAQPGIAAVTIVLADGESEYKIKAI